MIMTRSAAMLCLAGLSLMLYAPAPALTQAGETQKDATAQVLDRVIAVVNNRVILESDLELELRLEKLIPITDPEDGTPVRGLERLITRALIEQQIVQEDPQGLEIAPKELVDSLSELRLRLPACKHRDCNSEAGWSAYLLTMGLTPDRVSEYWSNRMAVLRFIERRFRSGIRIAPEEIDKYYQQELVPQYSNASEAPVFDDVSPRIQEILLQQRVNAMMNDWLKSLTDQGQVEILDPSLRGAAPAAAAKPGGGV